MVTQEQSTSTATKIESVLLLRWLLIIATSYLILFSRPLTAPPPAAALFVAAYFGSNLIFPRLLPRVRSQRVLDITLVLFDVVAVCIGVALTAAASSDFFVVYFVVLFLSALTERLELVVGAAVLIAAAHLYTVSRFIGVDPLVRDGYMLRIPFLFAVALFFGNLVGTARSRERAVEEKRARELRMEFLSTVSHDLKNPLGVIQSLAMLLLEGDAGQLNEDQTGLVRRIHASVRHISTVSFNIIDAARIDVGRLVLQRTPVHIADVADDALLLARSASELKGLQLHCIIEPNLPVVHIDPLQVERVIANLLDNAIKYTPAGGTVTLAIRRVADRIVLCVGDDGTGIAADELPTLFEKYRRQAESNGVPGSGLGLYIVKAIVEGHGGTVDVSSTLGSGTTLTVSLPLTSAAAAAAPHHTAVSLQN